MEENIKKTIENLQRRQMNGHVALDRAQLFEYLEALIPAGAVVGSGDSVTLEQTGVFDFLRERYTFLDKHKQGLTAEDKRAIYLQNFGADVFVTGSNAVTEAGEIFNIDGNGSRVAPMLYGPGRVIVVVGENKIVKSGAEAMHRARQVAAPLDARRIGKQTPCVRLGACVDCQHPQRICNDFVCIAGQFDKARLHVIILAGEFGY